MKVPPREAMQWPLQNDKKKLQKALPPHPGMQIPSVSKEHSISAGPGISTKQYCLCHPILHLILKTENTSMRAMLCSGDRRSAGVASAEGKDASPRDTALRG